MARMIPAEIQFRESGAERRLFHDFCEQLDARYTVLHHVPWTLRDPRRRSIEGEADFIIVHPERGAIVLEVKGGLIRYDGERRRWFQRSLRADDEHGIKDPFRQAADGARAILAYLNSRPSW